MQLKTSKEGLTKILKLCNRNGFFNLQSVKDSATSIQYGAPGSLFRRNIWREWLSSVINNVDVSIYPIEVVNSKNQLKPFIGKPAAAFLPDVFENYFKMLPFIGRDVPCGFAAYGPSLGLNQATKNSQVSCDSPILRKLESRHGLCIVFFCPIKKSSDWFNYWTRYRHRWWRKLSSIPSKFLMSDVTETDDGEQQISLLMEFPWGNESLERITIHKEDFFRNSCHSMALKPGDDLNLSVIVCESELNLAAFSYICNSFSEKWRDGEIRKILQLHTKLAPYKVCISVRSKKSEDFKSLGDVAKHLEKELKKQRVAVYPYWVSPITDKPSYFSRYDEMGVPYTIILDDKALHSGIAHLRNRDTTLEEQVHITELTPKLYKYLQMKSFAVDEM